MNNALFVSSEATASPEECQNKISKDEVKESSDVIKEIAQSSEDVEDVADGLSKLALSTDGAGSKVEVSSAHDESEADDDDDVDSGEFLARTDDVANGFEEKQTVIELKAVVDQSEDGETNAGSDLIEEQIPRGPITGRIPAHLTSQFEHHNSLDGNMYHPVEQVHYPQGAIQLQPVAADHVFQAPPTRVEVGAKRRPGGQLAMPHKYVKPYESRLPVENEDSTSDLVNAVWEITNSQPSMAPPATLPAAVGNAPILLDALTRPSCAQTPDSPPMLSHFSPPPPAPQPQHVYSQQQQQPSQQTAAAYAFHDVSTGAFPQSVVTSTGHFPAPPPPQQQQQQQQQQQLYPGPSDELPADRFNPLDASPPDLLDGDDLFALLEDGPFDTDICSPQSDFSQTSTLTSSTAMTQGSANHNQLTYIATNQNAASANGVNSTVDYNPPSNQSAQSSTGSHRSSSSSNGSTFVPSPASTSYASVTSPASSDAFGAFDPARFSSVLHSPPSDLDSELDIGHKPNWEDINDLISDVIKPELEFTDLLPPMKEEQLKQTIAPPVVNNNNNKSSYQSSRMTPPVTSPSESRYVTPPVTSPSESRLCDPCPQIDFSNIDIIRRSLFYW